MDIFTQKKLLIRIVILLTFLNLLLITILVIKNYPVNSLPVDPPSENRDLSAVLKRELKLSDSQVQQIKDLRRKYIEIEKTLEVSIKGERDSINVAMFTATPDSLLVLKLARRVADNEYSMELLRFQQAQELKTICTPEQLERFEDLLMEIRDYFRKDNPPAANQKPRPVQEKKKEPGNKRQNKPPRE
jgi:Spy/CpxP family protein refolding chaperone